MSPLAELKRKIEENMQFSIAYDDAMKYSKYIQQLMIDFSEQDNLRSYIKTINFAIKSIQSLKRQFDIIPGFYTKISDDGVIICRAIRESFNKLTQNKSFIIRTKSNMFDRQCVSNLSLCIPDGKNECCFIITDKIGNNFVIYEIHVYDLIGIESTC